MLTLRTCRFKRFTVRFHWLLSSVLGIAGSLLIGAIAEAGTLESWRFNTNENRLVFTTDDGVQPVAQLLSGPTRVVIDLPGISLGRSTLRQSVGGGIREVRVGQFDGQTTRIVIELDPGYTLDPQQILVRGATPTSWSVQLPTVQRAAEPVTPPTNAPTRPSTPVSGVAQLNSFQVTSDGFFLATSGGTPRLELERTRDRNQIRFRLSNTLVSSQLTQRDIPIDRDGVDRLEISQTQNSPPVTRITLHLTRGRQAERNRRGWQASISSFGGVVLLPSLNADSRVTNATSPNQPTPTRPTPPTRPTTPTRPSTGLAQIETVELSTDGRQLLIRADQPIIFTSNWERSGAYYRISIPDAQLAERVVGPQLSSNSPLQQVRLLQEDDRTVAILVQPAAGVSINEVVQPTERLLAVELRGSIRPPFTPPGTRPPTSTPPPFTPPPANLPRVPNGRMVVTIDPGHGGGDPGAVGIGGLREKDVVLSVSQQVASLLQQQGVQVVLTRQGDQEVELEPRVQIAERANSDLFVSIHANAISLDRPDVNGIETYYASDSGARLGRVIHASMVQQTGMNDRGLRSARFYVIRNTSMPAVLLEIGFVTGAQDAARLSDPRWRTQMATAITQGILQYIQQNF